MAGDVLPEESNDSTLPEDRPRRLLTFSTVGAVRPRGGRPAWEDGSAERLRSWYINMLTVDEAGMTRRETILDGFGEEHNAQLLCRSLNAASMHVGELLGKNQIEHRTDDMITLTFRW
jgi:hypothetical protein